MSSLFPFRNSKARLIMPILKLNQKLKRVQINKFELENDIIFKYFDKLSEDLRDDNFRKALYIGVLALMEDRLSSFLAKTQNELGTELENLKIMFDMKMELFFKSTIKGVLAEDDINEFLNSYFKEKGLKDECRVTGTEAGIIPKNKTGDLMCKIDGSGKQIAIECKFDKSIKIGDIASKDIFTRKSDTAWSQLIEAQANRGTTTSIIVFDRSLVDASILKIAENVGFIPAVGFVTIIDSNEGDYSNLVIAYNLARDLVLNSRAVEVDYETLGIIIIRIIKTIEETQKIRKLVESNIKNNQEILGQLEKSMLMMEFNQEYLNKFLNDGKLSKEDLFNFYMGEEVKEKFKEIENNIKSIGS